MNIEQGSTEGIEKKEKENKKCLFKLKKIVITMSTYIS